MLVRLKQRNTNFKYKKLIKIIVIPTKNNEMEYN